jgi:hypothetical protein
VYHFDVASTALFDYKIYTDIMMIGWKKASISAVAYPLLRVEKKES